jgi:PIN domain nuclease of toxin-antitoxin system
VKLLIDTHALIWAFAGDPRLSGRAADAVRDPRNDLFFSVAGHWEICIKISLGKLRLRPGWENAFGREMARNRVRWLPLKAEHSLGILALPFHHRDPFDRLYVAQARCEMLCIVTASADIGRYDVPVLW